MFVFFVVERFYRGHSGEALWSVRYYDTQWQIVFDLFNSLPLIGIAAALAYVLGRRRAVWAFASMALHAVMDLPLHSDDGHRHFYPLSDFRFDSPVSYWDPAHYGAYAATGEAVAVVVACFVVRDRSRSRWASVPLLAVACGYVALCGAMWLWTARQAPSS
jgi:hypothetical protein